jgi:hypothetical protein
VFVFDLPVIRVKPIQSSRIISEAFAATLIQQRGQAFGEMKRASDQEK